MGGPNNSSFSDGMINSDLSDRLEKLEIDPRSSQKSCTLEVSPHTNNTNSHSRGYANSEPPWKNDDSLTLSHISKLETSQWNDGSGDGGEGRDWQFDTIKRRCSKVESKEGVYGDSKEDGWDNLRINGTNGSRRSILHNSPSSIQRQQKRMNLPQPSKQHHQYQSQHQSDRQHQGQKGFNRKLDIGYAPESKINMIKSSLLYNIQSQSLHHSQLTHLTLLRYEFRMDEILEALHLLPSLEGIRQHQHYSDSEDQANIDKEVEQLHWSAGCMKQESGYKLHSNKTYTCNQCSRQFRKTNQFPTVKSITFRGTIVIPELLEFLPNLETLSLEEVDSPRTDTTRMHPKHVLYNHGQSKYNMFINTYGDEGRNAKNEYWSDCLLNTTAGVSLNNHSEDGGNGMSRIALMVSNIAQSLLEGCPRLIRLVLFEPQLIDDQERIRDLDRIGQPQEATLLLQAVPQLREFVANMEVVTRCPGLVDTLLEYHYSHLSSFEVLGSPQGKIILNNQYLQHLGNQPSLGFQKPQQQQQQQIESLIHLRQSCLRILETSPKLEAFVCKVPIPLEDLIASVPRWASGSTLKELQLEIQELTEEGGLDSEEEEVLQMFIKSLFKRSPPPVMSFENPWSDFSISRATGCSPQLYASADQSAAGSTSTGTVGSRSSSHSSCSLGVDSISAPSGDSFMAGSGDTTSRSRSQDSRLESPYLSLGGGNSDQFPNNGLNQSFATEYPQLDDGYDAIIGSCVSSGEHSSVGNGRRLRGLHQHHQHRHQRNQHPYQSHHHNHHRDNSENSYEHNHSRRLLPSPPTPPEFLNDIAPKSGVGSSFANACPSYYQVGAVGRLVALQFLVEHQLIYLPKLDRLIIGDRLYKLPTKG
ncbi:hypothetical protein BGZ76_004543 [Entomortierella beljakovae]|nr:hypothetical protein BGZ76_004543 [Entomortierella beljakovae]